MANVHIISFIQSLNDEEVKSAKDYILKVLSACRANSAESKQLLLFNYIIANKDENIAESEISKITETKNTASLKLNLYETVTEALTLNKNTSNENLFSEQQVRFYKLKKKLLLLRILDRAHNQKRFITFLHLLNEVITEAEKYQLYELLVEALIIKKYKIGLRAGIKEFEKINDEINFYDYCLKVAQNANDCYYRLILDDNLAKTLSQKEVDNFFQLSIKQLEFDHKKTGSEQVAYYLYIIRFALCEREKNYLEGIDYCNKIIAMLKKSKVIYRKDRMGFVLDNISQFKIYIGNYEAAAMDAKKAQEYYIENSFHYITSKEQEFYAYIYDDNIQEALKCTTVLLKHSPTDTGKFRRSKYVYYHACVLFQLKKYTQAQELLRMPLEIEKDKKRWNVSLRIFKIMLLIELNKIDEVGRALESLRKQMERTIKNDEIKPRDVLIVKLLRELEKDGFEFQAKNVKITTMLKELSEKDTPVSWEHYTAELIPFHKWLEGKKL